MTQLEMLRQGLEIKSMANAVRDRAEWSRENFPNSTHLTNSITEVHGEIAHYIRVNNREAVTDNCILLAALAIRLAVEGDPSVNLDKLT